MGVQELSCTPIAPANGGSGGFSVAAEPSGAAGAVDNPRVVGAANASFGTGELMPLLGLTGSVIVRSVGPGRGFVPCPTLDLGALEVCCG
ncbi:hypothetical protein FHX77_001252 [Bifidobacterium commune]|uniref:hypothetical protein n=1 Tax=Bifidobacterium commune TaxID=1505727 RepID=UPI0011778E5F|nr:hypothetical protein [Bifidobacterium commune]MBB2955819.1 hypothetical protein [Bifidobacterium commune]